MKNQTIYKFGALGFASAFLCFFVMGLFLLPLQLVDPAEDILAGVIDPSSGLFEQYIKILPYFYIFDTLLIVGWLTGWIGVSVLVLEKHRILGFFIVILGTMGPFLDFTENEIARALIEAVRETGAVSSAGLVIWKIVRNLSFLFSYTAAILAGFCLMGRGIMKRIAAVVCIFGSLAALAGIYIHSLWIISNFWWPLWFASMGLLLWREDKAAI